MPAVVHLFLVLLLWISIDVASFSNLRPLLFGLRKRDFYISDLFRDFRTKNPKSNHSIFVSKSF
jgi:hypothetical protein